MNAIYVVFQKELMDAVRSRWLPAYALTFAAVALALAVVEQHGAIGAQGFNRTTASLLNLCLLLVPLLALILGAGAVAAERERGTLGTLLAQPLSAMQLLVGKYAGLSVALWSAVALGFGTAGLLLALVRPINGLSHFLLFVGLSGTLAMAMLSVGMLVSVLAPTRVKALSLAILTWFALVLAYDLVAIGVALTVTSSGQSLLLAAMLNPVESIRILAVMSLEPDLYILGPLGAYLHTELGVLGSALVLGVTTMVWIALPLTVAGAVFQRQDA